jgi:hypothetical protein
MRVAAPVDNRVSAAAAAPQPGTFASPMLSPAAVHWTVRDQTWGRAGGDHVADPDRSGSSGASGA